MNEKEEASYILGSKAAWRRILHEAARELELDMAHAAVELTDTREQLRQVFEAFDIEGWSDDLYLADLVEKALYRFLQEQVGEA